MGRWMWGVIGVSLICEGSVEVLTSKRMFVRKVDVSGS